MFVLPTAARFGKEEKESQLIMGKAHIKESLSAAEMGADRCV